MSVLTFLIYISYGVFFTLSMLFYAKPHIFWGSKQLVLSGQTISAKTAFFPFLLFTFITFIVFTVFRDSSVGTDYYHYINLFNLAQGVSFYDYLILSRGLEPLYALVSYLLRILTDNILWLLFLSYVLIFVAQIKLFSKTKGFLIPFLAYLVLFYLTIPESFNILRNHLAAVTSIWGFLYLDKKKYIPAFLVFLTATLIHFTALFCFVVWLMCIICNRQKFEIKRFITLVLFGIIVTLVLVPYLIDLVLIIRPLYAYYLVDGGSMSISRLSFFAIVLFASMFYSKKLIEFNSFNKIMTIALGCVFIIAPLQLLTEMIARMFVFINIALFFLVYGLFSVIKINKSNLFPTISILALIGLLALGVFYINVTVAAEQHGITNYKHMWFY